MSTSVQKTVWERLWVGTLVFDLPRTHRIEDRVTGWVFGYGRLLELVRMSTCDR